MGDIDVLVLPEDFERTYQLLSDSNYKTDEKAGGDYRRHVAFWAETGQEIELHRYFYLDSNDTKSTEIDHWFYEKLKTVKKTVVYGYEVPVFPDSENGWVLLEHIMHHLTGGLGLRQIIDWMFFVQNVLDDAFWENGFKEKVQLLGLEVFAKTVTRMCQIFLGLTEEITWCRDADENLAEYLMQLLFEKGNFGSKMGGDVLRSITAMRRFFHLSNIFGYLTEVGMIHMEEAGLKPVKAYAWLYQIGHLMRKTVKRAGQRGKLSAEYRKSQEEKEFLRRLDVLK